LNVAVVAPARTVTVAGTVPTAVLLEERATTKPPVGAALESVTVPTDGVPPVTLVGMKARLLRTGAVMARGAFAVAPYADAEMLAVTLAPTATVVMVNVAELDPAGMLTDAGTVAFALSDVR